MKAILVDDETLALMQLQIMLENEVDGVEVAGTYTDPLQAIELARELQPDVVFLDINMPGIDGMETGKRFRAILPQVEIVFVTGYRQYALDAFEVSALDYIMKPILLERLRSTVERLHMRLGTNVTKQAESRFATVGCFNHLVFQPPGEEPRVTKWRTAKAQELFAYLLHHRDQLIDREDIITMLWPDMDMSRATQQLYSTIYHIRQTLKQSGIKSISINSMGVERGYVLSVGNATIDKEEWEKEMKQIEAPGQHNIREHKRVFAMYKGDYLGDYGYLWAEYETERLRRLWLNHAYLLSDYYLEQKLPESAIEMNNAIQQRYPLEEESYFNLMKLYNSLGNRMGVSDQYNLLNTRLAQELDIACSAPISAWYKSWNKSTRLGV